MGASEELRALGGAGDYIVYAKPNPGRRRTNA